MHFFRICRVGKGSHLWASFRWFLPQAARKNKVFKPRWLGLVPWNWRSTFFFVAFFGNICISMNSWVLDIFFLQHQKLLTELLKTCSNNLLRELSKGIDVNIMFERAIHRVDEGVLGLLKRSCQSILSIPHWFLMPNCIWTWIIFLFPPCSAH